MKIPKIKWKRINVDGCFVEGVTDVECIEKKENLKESKKNLHGEYLWKFQKHLSDFIKESAITEKYVGEDGLYDKRFSLKEGDVLKENIQFIVPRGKSLKVFLDYHSEKKAYIYSNYEFSVLEDATLELIRIQRTSDDSKSFFETLVEVKNGGNVEITDIQIGSEHKIINTEVKIGEGANSEISSVFVGEKNTFSDLSYTSHHEGRRGTSIIEGKGVLKKNAKKVFRGNLHFDRGSSKSVGREEENCLLFSEHILSDSLPALMCDEDDVIGEHAASIGRFDDSKLFYLMTRGFSEEAARKVIVRSVFNPSLEKIGDEKLKGEIIENIERRFREI